MTTLISKEINLYMVFDTPINALTYARKHLTINIDEEIITKKYDWFFREKSNGARQFVSLKVYEHKTKL